MSLIKSIILACFTLLTSTVLAYNARVPVCNASDLHVIKGESTHLMLGSTTTIYKFSRQPYQNLELKKGSTTLRTSSANTSLHYTFPHAGKYTLSLTLNNPSSESDPWYSCNRDIIVNNNTAPELVDATYSGTNNEVSYDAWHAFSKVTFKDINNDVTSFKLSYEIYINGVKREDSGATRICSLKRNDDGFYVCGKSIWKSQFFANATYKFRAEVIDSKGNETTHTYSYLVKEENTPPTLQVKIDGTEAEDGSKYQVVSGHNLTLEVKGHDNDKAYTNRIDKIELDIGNGYTDIASFTGNTCKRSTLTLKCTGIVIPVTQPISGMKVRVIDRAGASQTMSFNVNLATPPAVTLAATNTTPFVDESVTLAATASHASGLQEYKICRAPGNFQTINNGCVTAIKTCSTTSSHCTVTLEAPGQSGQFTYYAYAVTQEGASNAFSQVINYADFFGIGYSKPSKSTYVVGREQVKFTVYASAFSRHTASGGRPKLTSLTLLRNGSPVSGGVYISPSIDNLELPLASNREEAKTINFSWMPSNEDAGSNIELALVAEDNDGNSSTARLPDIRIVEEKVDKPGVPEIQLIDLGAGLIEVNFSKLTNMGSLNMRATLDGVPYPMKVSEVPVSSRASYITTIQTKFADHGKQLRVYGYGTRTHNREIIKGEEGSSEPIPVVNHEVKSHAPVFNSEITQAGGHFALNWAANTDGVTQSYQLVTWKGLPSDRSRAPHSVLTNTSGTSHLVTDIVQGHYTYEIRACNSQGVCTAGQQHTVEHIAPYIDAAKIEECGAECAEPKAKVTVSGVGFSASQSTLYARLRGTGDTFYIPPQNLSLSGYTLTGTLPEIVRDGLLDNGVEITITNGVLSGEGENNTHLENTVILDKTGSAQRPNLRGREFTVSESKVLYVGGEEGGLNAHKVNLDGDLQYLWTYPESGHQNVQVTAKPLVRLEPISDIAGARKVDNIYFGSLNHHFYRLTYDPIANLEVTTKWQFQTQGEIRAGAQFDQNNALLIGSMDEAIYSLDSKTGLANWHYTFPRSGGIVMAPQVSASGHIYVTTADREVHVIDQRMIGANAVKWQEIDALALQFEDEIKEWEAQWWHPDQNTDGLVILTKAMLVLLQRTPSKKELSFMAYLMVNGHPLNEMINALINIEPSLSESSNAQFISTLFEYLQLKDVADQVLSGAKYGSGDQAYWVRVLEMGVTRADVIIDLLGQSHNQYEAATFNLLKYFYGRCLVSDYCDYDYDSDKDGLSDRLEEAIGTNPADHRDGLHIPTLSATEHSGIIEFMLTAPGRVEEYQLYALQPGNPQYQLFATLDADKTKADNVGVLTSIFKQNGSYQFKALACLKLPDSLADKVVSRCSNNYSNEAQIIITSSAVEGSPSVALPSVDVAPEQAPSKSVLLAHARLQPTTGSFRVTESGAASYSVPIALPAGITGVQPEVSLNYSSQGGDGLVALGWNLSATSGISRCRQTKAQDGQFKGLTLSEDDRYCLDGQRLISKAVQTHSGSFEGEQIADEYMTEIDAQITVYKLGEGSQSQFVVLAKDGSVKRYGVSETSRTNLTDADSVVHTMSWMLSEVKDNLGHQSTTINYVYTELTDPDHSANSEKVLSEINYSGNRVVFTHEVGALRHAGYVDTAKVTQFARLSNIEVFNHEGAELAHYDLDFVDAANGTRLLQSIAHCRGSVCRAPVSFSYDAFASKLDFEAFSNVYSKERMDNALSSVTLADLKASGLAQLVTLEQTDKGAKRYTLCVYQGHTYQAAEELACRDIYRKDDQESVSMFAIDHDLDGRQTLMINLRSEHTSDANPGYWAHYALNDNNQLQTLSLPEGWPANHYMREIKPADLNGDGYADLVYKHKKDDPNLYVRLADPDTKAFGHQYVLGTDVGEGNFYGYGDFTSKGTDWHVIDMNFDGLADIVALKCDSTHCNNDDAKRLAVHYNQGESGYGGFNPFLTETIASDEKIELLTPSDVNGDGLVDLIYLATPEYNHDVKQWHVQLNQSSERVKFRRVFIATAKSSNDTLSVSELIPPMSMDIDKNGKADLFFKEKNTKKWRRYEWSTQSERFTKLSDNAFELAVDTRGGDFAFFSDYDGNGVADILIKHDYGVSVRYNLSQRPTAGMLLEVNQGYAGHTNSTTIHYGLMSDRAVYTDVNDDLTADLGLFNAQQLLVSKMTGAGVLVASVETDSPSNRSGALSADKAKVDYHYQGARVQFGGRGPLGFKVLKTTTQKDGKTFETTTRYHQAFPFTGMPYSTQKRMQTADTSELLSISVNEYSKHKSQQLNDVTAYRVYNSDSRECSAVVDSGMSVSAYTCTDTTTLQDTYGNVENLSVNTYDVDASGAEHFTTVGATGTVQHSVVTENQYGTTDVHKRLGRLSETKVTHSGAGLTAISKTSHFEYYPENHAHENMLYKEVVGKGLGCEYELTTEHSYDSFGNKVKVQSENTACTGSERETRTSESIFDPQGRYVLHTKKSGSKSALSLISEKVRTVEKGQHTLTRRNEFGQPTELIDNNGVLTKLTYDHFGGKVGSYSKTGAQAYSYFTACKTNENCVVRLNKEVNGVLREKHLLDKMGRTYSVSKLTVLENQWLTSEYQFDRYGRNDVVIEAGSKTVTSTYDALDRVKKVYDANSDTESETTFEGRKTTVTVRGSDIRDQVKSTLSNTIGQTVQVIDNINHTLDYTYNALGVQLTVQSSAEAANDRLLSTITYDDMGRKEFVQDSDRGYWQYTYNAFGELLTQTDARGVKLTMDYDFLGRKIKQEQTTPEGVFAEGTSTWVYGDTNDTVHRLISSSQGSDWGQTYYYDTLGRAAATLTSLDSTSQCAGQVSFVGSTGDLRIPDGSNLDPIDNLCVIQQSFYDSYSRLALQFDDYRRDEQGELIEARGVAMTYQNGQLLAKTEARNSNKGQVYYKVTALNARGQVTTYEKGGVTMNIVYDQKGMVEKISDSNFAIQSDVYSFDSLGNLISSKQIGMDTRTYHYDDMNRVLGVNNVDLFKYSASGNLTEKADYLIGTDVDCPGYEGSSVLVLGRWNQRYGEDNTPLHAISSRSRIASSSCLGTLPAKTESFSYDANGNQIARSGSDGTTSIEYSARNKAVEMTGNGETVTFRYDANNRRYKRVDGSNTVYYVGALELTKPKGEDGKPVINRYIGNDAQQTYFDTGMSKTKWLFTDHQGSTIVVTNGEHKVLARYAYDIFGKQREVEQNSELMGDVFNTINDNLRAYTGHEPVSLGGDKRIIHMNGRIYDADTGRFMQADPVVQAPSNLQNYNAYSYVLNNPLSYTDPSGYLFKKLLKGAMKATGTWQMLRAIGKVPWLNTVVTIGLNFIPGCQGWCAAAATAAYSAGSTFATTGSLNKGLTAGLTAAAMPGGGSAGAILASAAIGGVSSKLMGGNFGHGFFAAGLGAAAGSIGGGIRNPLGKVVISAIVGGTVSKVTGGKFANGAFSAAFSAAMRADWSSQGSNNNSNGRTGSVCSPNPINISTGEKYFTMRDYQAAGNSRLKFERYYFSYSKTKTSLGMGWSHNFDRKLEFIKGNKQLVRYLGLNKKERTFSRKNSKHDSYENTANTSEHLQQIDSGWVLTLADGTTEIFNEHGRLIEVHEIGLYQQFLKYNNKGMLTSVTDSMGVEIHLEYNLAGLLTKLETPEGTFEYEYNLANRTLVKALRPASRDGERGYKKYHYGNYEYRSAITHISNEQGNILHRVRYDDNGRAVSSALGSDIEKVNIRFLPNKQSIVTNSLGFKTTYTFNDSNQPLNVAGDGGTSCLSTNQQYEYDGRGNVTKSTDWNGVITTYSYNDRDLEISRTEALGTDIERTTLTEWHDVYPVKELVQTEKAKQVFEYSGSGLLLSHTTFDLTAEQNWLQNLMDVFPSRTTHYHYNSRGLVVEVDGPRTDVADVTTYEYDELGNQISVTNALGYKTEVTKHNPSGRPLVITHANGSMTELAYNESGWISSKTNVTFVDGERVDATTRYEYAHSGDNSGKGLIERISHPNGGVTRYTYDEAYRVKTMSNHLGETIEYVRDPEGNPIEKNVLNRNGELVKQQRQQFNELSQLIAQVGVNSQVSHQYNGNGQVTSTTNGLGNTTHHAFDALNRLVQTTDSDGGVVHQYYDVQDKVTQVTDQRGLTTEYQYNGFGEKVKQISPDTGTTVYKHNSAGLVIEKVDNAGQVVSYEYDAIGRVTHVHFVGAANEDIFYQYDEQLFDSAQPPAVSGAIGKVTRILDNSGDSQYQYNGQGYLTSKTYQIEGRQYSQGFNYKDKGLLDSQVYPSGMVVSYGYDEAGRVNTLFSNSFAGNTTTLVENVEYLPFAEPELISYGNGIMQQNTYDTDGRMGEILLTSGLNTLLNRHYVYDEANQITNIVNVKDDVLSEYFEYDNLGRLTFASGEYGQLSYDYDPVGNRLNRRWLSKYSELLEDVSYQYALNSNQLEQVLPISKPERVFEYNVNGQTTVDTLNGKSLVYNAANRLSEITFRDGSQVQYVYNAKGQRVAKVQTASNGEKTTTHYHFDQNNLLIAESNAQGEPLVEYIYLNKQRVASIRYMGSSHVVDYVHNDHLGSPMVQTDISGKLTWRSNTLPFGQSYKVTVAEQGFGFPGQYHDVESGYSYNYFRDYDPSLGRYIQSDPIGLAGGVNTYGYVLGNPIQSSDTWGLYVDLDWYHGARPVKAMNFGTAVHSHVNRQFNQMGYSVEGAGFARSFFGGGRPDIVDPRTSQVWEIKPMSHGGGTAYNKAVSQINGYADASGLKIGNSIDLVGEYFDANIMFFDGAAYHIGLYPYTNGLVLYDVTKLTNEQALAYYYAIDQTAKSTILGHQNKEVNACPVF